MLPCGREERLRKWGGKFALLRVSGCQAVIAIWLPWGTSLEILRQPGREFQFQQITCMN